MKKLFFCGIFIVLAFNLSFAQSTIVPIAELNLKALLGGVQNGKWLTVQETASKFKKNTEFVLIGLNGVEEGGVTLGNIEQPDVPCEDFYPVKLELNTDTGIALGSTAKWNFFPRVPQKIAPDNKIYQRAVSDFLKKQGILKTTIKLTQAFRVDLDGDGQEEVVISATFYKKGLAPSAAKNDYSTVFVRKIVGKKVEDILIGGDFVTKDIKFGAPNLYEISSIADLNGDGKMEIVIYGEYYEGNWAEVYETKGNKFVKVLSTGCGV